jgi:hypothetical protein
VLDFSKSSSGPLASPHVLDVGDDEQDNLRTVQEEVPAT